MCLLVMSWKIILRVDYFPPSSRDQWSFLRHGTHKAFTVSLQLEWSCTTFRISLQVRCMDLSSYSADLLQVILGLPHCRFPSDVQNKLSLATLSESFLNTCSIHVHFLQVKSTLISSCIQMFHTSKLVISYSRDNLTKNWNLEDHQSSKKTLF